MSLLLSNGSGGTVALDGVPHQDSQARLPKAAGEEGERGRKATSLRALTQTLSHPWSKVCNKETIANFVLGEILQS